MSSRRHAKTPTTRTAPALSAIAAGVLATPARPLRLPGRGASARRRKAEVGFIASRLALAVGAALAAAALFAPAASADSQVCEAGSESGQCAEPSGVAVYREAALLFVADKGNNRVDVFDAEDGRFLRAFGWGVADGSTAALQVCTTECHKGLAGSGDGQLSGPLGIAVDNDPGSAALGDVYVYDGTNARVQRFHPNGEFVGKWGVGGKGAGQFESIRGIGVGPAGEVYVADTWPVAGGCAGDQGGKFEKRIQRFTSAGAVNADFKLTDARCGEVEAFAVGSGGEFYLGNAGASGAVREYASGGGSALVTFNESTKIAGLGTAPGGEVFVADTMGEGEALGAEHVATYTTAGAQTSTVYGDARRPMVDPAPFSGPLGGFFAVVQGQGVLAVSLPPAGPVVLPGTTGASEIRDTSATVESQVNPEGRATTYRLEYVDDSSYRVDGFADAIVGPPAGPVGPDFEPHLAQLAVTGLTRNTEYHVRLVAEDDQGHVTVGPEGVFSTFGIHDFEVTFTDSEGQTQSLAGSHPDEMTVSFAANADSRGAVVEAIKDVEIFQIPGFVGSQTAVDTCETLDFLAIGFQNATGCADNTAVGRVLVEVSQGTGAAPQEAPVYNLTPVPGTVARLGFSVLEVPVTIAIKVSPEYPNRLLASSRNISQVLEFYSAKFTLWGVPGDESHDEERGECYLGGKSCPTGETPVAFLTLPRACEGPLRSDYEVDPWQSPGAWVTGFALTPPMLGCGDLSFSPSTTAAPTSRAASSPSGLDFSLDFDDPGLANPNDGARAAADVAKAVVTLPKGMTINPSQADGLAVCTEADLARESADTRAGEGCPEASKIGTVEVQTPILDRAVHGSIYVAEPYRNRFGSLIALYMVIRDAELGLVLKLPLKVEPDPQTGQLVTISEQIPPYPFASFKLHLREGGRSPLITPPGCGSFETKALLYPSSGGAPIPSTSAFEIVSGPGGGACPSGTAQFHPGFQAGTRNNAAGSYSPFDMRIVRGDGEQDITKFSSVLPPGVVARLAGTSWCPESGIARAKSRTGENGGIDERNDPSCPASSQIGTTSAGAGAGSQLTYVPGKIYLAGPYNGAPLSVVAITPAVAGPFDAGTVVVREALTLNPVTGVAEVDGAASDPIPHILQGIPLNLRELQVRVDKPDFTLNATSCAESQTQATLWGGGTALLPLPDSPVALSSRYQAASCASLAFKPKLAIKLFGGVKRGDFPALRAIVTPPSGQANFARAAVTLPRSAFLEQGHIRTICTRVQFAAGAGHGSQCPKGAIYGKARAWSPLLDAPAEGPVFLRSSSNKLPDLVVALKGPPSAPVDVELSSRIDSVKIGRDGAGIRSIFTGIPDLPVSRFVLAMQGGQKGLIVNSGNLCRKPARNRARANLLGQNGRRYNIKPVVRAVKCAKQKKRRKARRARASHRRAR